MAIADEAKLYYEQYRQNNKNIFMENIYLFFPEHYLNLEYTLSNKPKLDDKKFIKEWDRIIQRQQQLEQEVLSALGIEFEELQKEVLNFKSTETELQEQLKYNEEASRIIQKTIEDIIVENQVFLTQNRDVKVVDLIKKEMLSNRTELYDLLSNLYDRVQKNAANKELKVSSNILKKIISYQYLAREDLNEGSENIRPREIRNINKKKYTVNKVIESIQKSLSGTLNNIGSELDEVIFKEFLTKKLVQISSNNGNISVKTELPTGGKKVKADIRGTITTDIQDEKKELNFGISSKISSGSNIKLHSGGNLDTLIKWVSAYKGTGEIERFLRSNEFKFMLANELNAGQKGEAWEALQQMIRATLYIWIGNEFMMRDSALARKLFGDKIGSYNIAFICINKKLIRISQILENFKNENFSRYVNIQGEFRDTSNHWTQKRQLIKTLPTYNDYIQSNGIIDFPYPDNLINLGNKASKDILKRISYTINLNKNLLNSRR